MVERAAGDLIIRIDVDPASGGNGKVISGARAEPAFGVERNNRTVGNRNGAAARRGLEREAANIQTRARVE